MDDADKSHIEVLRPSSCTCAKDCPLHGAQSASEAVMKVALMKRAIINLAVEKELAARKAEPLNVSGAFAAAGRYGVEQIWNLLGECVCRTATCGHPASFHVNGKCQLCFTLHNRQDVCWK